MAQLAEDRCATLTWSLDRIEVTPFPLAHSCPPLKHLEYKYKKVRLTKCAHLYVNFSIANIKPRALTKLLSVYAWYIIFHGRQMFLKWGHDPET